MFDKEENCAYIAESCTQSFLPWCVSTYFEKRASAQCTNTGSPTKKMSFRGRGYVLPWRGMSGNLKKWHQ